MLESLFETVSTSGRLRTTSSSSVSFTALNLSSCDIFPEIAGVVSASDSETDVTECLMRGQDCFQVGETVFSPPQLKFRHISTNQSQDPEEIDIQEMLDTLCYKVQDLTDVNNVVQNVVLDWQSGAAFEDSLTDTEVVVKTESSCENTDVNSDESFINGYIASLSEGIVHFIEQHNVLINRERENRRVSAESGIGIKRSPICQFIRLGLSITLSSLRGLAGDSLSSGE